MNNSKLAIWSKQVKERDGKCLDCGTTQDLHAHHIKPKSSHPELSLDMQNGKTLCYRCHKAEHERYRLTNTIRVRSKLPHRKTLLKKIDLLVSRVEFLEKENARLRCNKLELAIPEIATPNKKTPAWKAKSNSLAAKKLLAKELAMSNGWTGNF